MLIWNLPVDTMSHTTLYHHERKHHLEAAVAAGLEQPPLVQRKHKKHKVHECKQCYQSLRGSENIIMYANFILGKTGHTNYYGLWHCSKIPNAVLVEEWKRQKKAEHVAKKVSGQQHQ